MNLIIQNIIDQLYDIQSGDLWVGANYQTRLDQISEEEAFMKPVAHMNSIAQIIAHLTIWRGDALLKINTGIGRLTDESELNWPSNDGLRKETWPVLYHGYKDSLDQLLHILKDREDSFLLEEYYDIDFKRPCSYNFMLTGLVHHDVYHLGQIGVVLKYIHLTRETYQAETIRKQ